MYNGLLYMYNYTCTLYIAHVHHGPAGQFLRFSLSPRHIASNRSKSLQHDQCNSGQLRATHAMHVTHATKNKHLNRTNNAVEIARTCNYFYEQKSPLQMCVGRKALCKCIQASNICTNTTVLAEQEQNNPRNHSVTFSVERHFKFSLFQLRFHASP